MTLPTSYSARPDGKLTIYDVIKMIPTTDLVRIEDAINDLKDNDGYGEVCIMVVKGKVTGWKLIESRKL